MSDTETNVRLALLEQGMDQVLRQLKEVADNSRRSAEAVNEIALVRSEQTRMQGDLAAANQRIAAVEQRHQDTVGKLWFWQGIAWGAGLVLSLLVGTITFIGAGALGDIKQLQATTLRVDADQKAPFREVPRL